MEYAHIATWSGKDETETGETWVKVNSKEASIICDALENHSKAHPRRPTIAKLRDQWAMCMPYFG